MLNDAQDVPIAGVDDALDLAGLRTAIVKEVGYLRCEQVCRWTKFYPPRGSVTFLVMLSVLGSVAAHQGLCKKPPALNGDEKEQLEGQAHLCGTELLHA